jgi:electron transfer flavoprotein alpha subunit
MNNDIWVYVQIGEHGLDESTAGLIGEGRQLADRLPEGRVTVAAVGAETAQDDLPGLGRWGADRAIFFHGASMGHYQGEWFAALLADALNEAQPRALLLAHNSETVDLAARLGALMETAVITRAVDAAIEPDGTLHAVRPIENGYLFEALAVDPVRPALICFLPSVLTAPAPFDQDRQMPFESVPVTLPATLKTRTLEYIQADPADLDIEESDIVVAAGRGAGRGPGFELTRQLAEVIGGSLAGTRPVIDWQLLPFERQIGQTGKTVVPRLIINCGISGANEYTAGIEKAQRVLAINTDPRARIFRFADLGVVADVLQLLPLLVERLKEVFTDDVTK